MKSPEKAIYQFLDTNGNGLGTTNANGDYGTPDEFYFLAKGDAELYRILIHIEDTTGATAADYGNITSGLTNGYEVKVMDGATELANLTGGVAIKTNGDIGRVCFDLSQPVIGAGNSIIQARWTFEKAGYPVFIESGNKLSITFSDDLQGLIAHYFMVQGYYV